MFVRHLLFKKHGLKIHAPYGYQFVVIAHEEGNWANRISSQTFCSSCGEAISNKSNFKYNQQYCKTHCIEFGELNEDDFIETKPVDLYQNANYIPDNVIAGEVFDDKLAMFRNEI